MMNKAILSEETQKWISENLLNDPLKLMLGKSPFIEISIKELVEQLISKQKSNKKLPTWFSNPNIYYPPKLSIEQTSSEKLAQYKSTLLKGNVLVDLTGGFGVDSYYFSKTFTRVIHCEKNHHLSEITQHNFLALEVSNIECFTGDGLMHLIDNQNNIDAVYLDPARRDISKSKLVLLEEYEPNVLESLEEICKPNREVLIKTSPMLDITEGIKKLKYVQELFAVSLHNELKELLWKLKKEDKQQEVKINAVNIVNDRVEHSFHLINDTQKTNFATQIEAYLYEPNASLMKTGGHSYLTHPVNKLSVNSHLFTSIELVRNFPGRTFKIKQYFEYNKKRVNTELKGKKANVACRNFPLTPEELKKKHHIKDGGDLFVFFSEWNSKHFVFICDKVI